MSAGQTKHAPCQEGILGPLSVDKLKNRMLKCLAMRSVWPIADSL